MSEAFKHTRELLEFIFKPGMEIFKAKEGSKAFLGEVIECIAGPFEELLASWDSGDKPVVLFENAMVPQLFYAFDCAPLCMEAQPVIFSGSNIEIVYKFLTLAEEAGIPADLCSSDRFFVGAALSGEYPGKAHYVTTTMPCDGTRTAYPIMEKIFKNNMCYLESTNAAGEDAARWFGKQLQSTLIPYLEDITGKKFDIDRFREVIDESNRSFELMTEIHESYTMSPAPQRSALRRVPHVGYMTQAGSPRLTEFFEKMMVDVKRYASGETPPKYEEKHRVLWAHIPPAHDQELFAWMESEFGASVVAYTIMGPRMMPIDTTDMDTMMTGYAWQGLDLSMSLLRMGAQDMLDYMHDLYMHFECDCIIMTQHVGCSNICGKEGVARYLCKKYDAPLLLLELDYNDDRITSKESVREQVENFFTTVMK